MVRVKDDRVDFDFLSFSITLAAVTYCNDNRIPHQLLLRQFANWRVHERDEELKTEYGSSQSAVLGMAYLH
jgi:hypothetical protein